MRATTAFVATLTGLGLLAGPAAATFRPRPGITWSYAAATPSTHTGRSYGIAVVGPNPNRDTTLLACSDDLDAGPETCPKYGHVSFSPDGLRLTWMQAVPGSPSQIVLASTNGQARTVLARAGERDMDPSFSADGLRLVYVRVQTGQPQHQIVTSKLAGGDIRPLGALTGDDPQWSPTGRQILFTRGRDIWTAGSKGQHPRRLLAGGSQPDFSPDGKQIVFIANHQRIYIARADGTGRHEVRAVAPAGLEWAAEGAVFSPNGRQIAFGSQTDFLGTGDPSIFVISVRGGRPRIVDSFYTDSGGGDVTGLSWQPR